MADSFLDAARDLAKQLHTREEQLYKLIRFTEKINYGIALDETLNLVYEEMQSVIPYNRIGFSLINDQHDAVVAHWARSDREIMIKKGHSAALAGSTLLEILETGRPRIINDLEAYLQAKPASASTALIVREGMQSSLTCPLIVQGKSVGFMFFSSEEKNKYSSVHVGFFMQLAGQLSAIVEKGRLYTELAEQKAIIEEHNQQMSRELEMARQIQRALIPQPDFDVPGFDIAFEYQPAMEVGGDIVDMCRLDDGRVLIFLGDAMGHGVQAALVMSAVKAALQSAVQPGLTAASVLSHLNKTLAGMLSGQFVTAVCCLVDPITRQAEFALAGHDMPLLYRAAQDDLIDQGEGALPLAIDEDASFESFQIQLAPGDVIVFSTDGIAEAFNPDEEQYGQDRLKSQLIQNCRASAGEILLATIHDLKRHCRGLPLSDDFTLLVFKAAEDGHDLPNELTAVVPPPR